MAFSAPMSSEGIVSISVDGNGNVTAWSKGSASGDGYDGIIISSKDLVSDGTNTTLTLHPIYTLDAIDRETAIPGYDGAEKLGELEDIYKLKLNVDYTVEWQYCSTYEAYEEFLSGSDEGMNWAAMDTSTSSDTCAIKQVYSYAFRAKITFLDTPKARAAYAEFDNYGAEAVDGERVLYSNILTVGDAEGRLFANIRKASSASANGDTLYIDALMMGGSTTPVGSLSVKVVDRFDNLVFEDTRNNVNGGTTFTWVPMGRTRSIWARTACKKRSSGMGRSPAPAGTATTVTVGSRLTPVGSAGS